MRSLLLGVSLLLFSQGLCQRPMTSSICRKIYILPSTSLEQALLRLWSITPSRCQGTIVFAGSLTMADQHDAFSVFAMSDGQ